MSMFWRVLSFVGEIIYLGGTAVVLLTLVGHGFFYWFSDSFWQAVAPYLGESLLLVGLTLLVALPLTLTIIALSLHKPLLVRNISSPLVGPWTWSSLVVALPMVFFPKGLVLALIGLLFLLLPFFVRQVHTDLRLNHQELLEGMAALGVFVPGHLWVIYPVLKKTLWLSSAQISARVLGTAALIALLWPHKTLAVLLMDGRDRPFLWGVALLLLVLIQLVLWLARVLSEAKKVKGVV